MIHLTLSVSIAIPLPARAQPVTARVFEGMEPGETEGIPNVRISFNLPVRYLSHSPRDSGDSIHIQFFPLNVSEVGAAEFFHRESLQLPRDLPAPIVEVVYDGIVAGRPILDLQACPFRALRGPPGRRSSQHRNRVSARHRRRVLIRSNPRRSARARSRTRQKNESPMSVQKK